MTARRVRWLLAGILCLGALARYLAWIDGPRIHADGYCQYLDPGWAHITGFGIKTWEWHDGLRSWVLPAYHGAWMAILAALGVPSPVIRNALELHWGLVSLAMVWAAWRAGASISRQLRPRVLCSCCGQLTFASSVRRKACGDCPPDGWQAGLLAAFLVATFPLLCMYSTTTLTELSSMIGLTVGLAIYAEMSETPYATRLGHAALLGGVLSLATCLRIVHGPVVLLPTLGLVVHRQWRALGVMILAALVPVAVFGIVDRLTWGQYFGSFIAHVKFNWLDGGAAAAFGSSPMGWYVDRFQFHLPLGLWLLLVPALLGIRANWPFLGSAAILFGTVTAQAHKEERFAAAVWPLLLIAAAGAAGRWLIWDEQPSVTRNMAKRWLGRIWHGFLAILIIAGAAIITLDGFAHREYVDQSLPRGRYRAQTWVGKQPDVTGLLVDELRHTDGYLGFGRTLPLVEYEPALLANSIFSHVMLKKGHSGERAALAAGFSPVFQQADFVVLKRPHP
jgi:GPI mannosyltransferase 3